MSGSGATNLIISALLAHFHHMPARHCIEAHRVAIATDAAAASERYNVPPEILISIGWEESWLSCHPGELSWGAPISRTRRHVPGGPFQAASSLAFGMRQCGTWLGAVHHFRNGRCSGGRVVGYTAEQAMHLAERIAPVPME